VKKKSRKNENGYILNGLNTIPVSNTIYEKHALKIKKFEIVPF